MAFSPYEHPRLFRHLMNTYPPYWGTGISLTELSPDFTRARVQMKKRFYNSNAFGTHFGGSLYAMCDPWYVLLLVALLGRDYVVWDKAATIDFLRPGSGTVTAEFDWTPEQIADIRRQAASGEAVTPVRTVEILNEKNKVVARVHKTLYIKRKER